MIGTSQSTADAPEGSDALTGRDSPLFLLAVLTVVNTVNWADRQVVPILFPALGESLGLSDRQLGIIGGLAFSLIYAVAAFVFGRASDTGIRRNLIAIGLVIWSLATAASGFANGFISLFFARFFTGVGEASLYPAAMSLLAERYPIKTRGRAMGIFGAAAAVGGGIGVGLGGVMADAFGWRMVFWVFGGAGLFLLPFLLAISEERRPESEAAMQHPFRIIASFFGDVRLVSLWIAGMTMIGSGMGLAAWLPSFLVRYRELDVAQTGTLMGASMLVGGLVGAMLGGHFADVRRKVQFAGELDVPAISAIVAIPAMYVALNSDSFAVLVAGVLVSMVAIFAFFPPLQTILVELVPPDRHGLAYAVNIFFLGGVGTGLGPYIVGLTSDKFGSLEQAMWVPILGFALACVLMRVTKGIIRSRCPERVAEREGAPA